MDVERPSPVLLTSATLYGERFSPRELLALTKLPLTHCTEKGDAVQIKQYSKIYEYGTATLETGIKTESAAYQAFDDLLDLLTAHFDAIQACGCSAITIWVVILYSVQGNWEVSPAQLKKLALLNASLAITYSTDGP